MPVILTAAPQTVAAALGTQIRVFVPWTAYARCAADVDVPLVWRTLLATVARFLAKYRKFDSLRSLTSLVRSSSQSERVFLTPR